MFNEPNQKLRQDREELFGRALDMGMVMLQAKRQKTGTQD